MPIDSKHREYSKEKLKEISRGQQETINKLYKGIAFRDTTIEKLEKSVKNYKTMPFLERLMFLFIGGK